MDLQKEIDSLKVKAGYDGKPQQWQFGFDLVCRELAKAIPDGFVLVPKEPTQKLYRTFYDAFNSANAGNTAQCFRVAYKAMIEAQEQSREHG